MHLPVRFRVALLAAGFGLTVSTPAHAVTLHTPTVPAAALEQVDCVVTNVGTKAATVSVQLFAFDGSVVSPDLDLCTGVPVVPRASCHVLPSPSVSVSCVITAKGKVRAAAYVFDLSNGSRLSGVVPATK